MVGPDGTVHVMPMCHGCVQSDDLSRCTCDRPKARENEWLFRKIAALEKRLRAVEEAIAAQGDQT